MQIYHKYTDWEDFKNGMFECKSENEPYLIEKSIELLCNHKLFYEICLMVLKEWVVSCEVNLSNKNSNRQSWIGQAACCYALGATESTTRKAWKLIDNRNKIKANLIADKIIKKYESRNRKIHKHVGNEMLF